MATNARKQESMYLDQANVGRSQATGQHPAERNPNQTPTAEHAAAIRNEMIDLRAEIEWLRDQVTQQPSTSPARGGEVPSPSGLSGHLADARGQLDYARKLLAEMRNYLVG